MEYTYTFTAVLQQKVLTELVTDKPWDELNGRLYEEYDGKEYAVEYRKIPTKEVKFHISGYEMGFMDMVIQKKLYKYKPWIPFRFPELDDIECIMHSIECAKLCRAWPDFVDDALKHASEQVNWCCGLCDEDECTFCPLKNVETMKKLELFLSKLGELFALCAATPNSRAYCRTEDGYG